MKAQIKNGGSEGEYSVGVNSVFFNKKKICNSFFIIKSYSRCATRGSYSIIACYTRYDSSVGELTFPREALLGSNLVKELTADGFDLVPGREKLVVRLLAQLVPKNAITYTQLSFNGWHVLDNNHLVYAFGSRLISRPEDRKKVTVNISNKNGSTFSTNGTLEQWQENISERVKGHFLLEFALSLSFASLLLKFTKKHTGFAVNIVGASSRGKSTGLQIACSVYGYAGELGENSRMNKANSTENGIEPLLSNNNDSLVALDELGMFQGAVGELSYRLSSGKSKSRMTSGITQKKQLNWRSLILTSGEIKASEMMEKSSGGRSKAGQLLRFIDLPIEQGTIEDNCGVVDKAKFADQMKRNVSCYYGTPAVDFLKFTTENYTKNELEETVENIHQYYHELLLETFPTDKPELSRVMGNLALVAVGAELAADAGVLLYEEVDGNYPEIEEFILKIAKRYLSTSKVISDAERGVINLTKFLLSNQNKFTKEGWSHGFRVLPKTGSKLFAIFKHSFNEITGHSGANKAVCKILREKGLLHINNNDRSLAQFKHNGERISVYAVSTKILELDENLNPINKL